MARRRRGRRGTGAAHAAEIARRQRKSGQQLVVAILALTGILILGRQVAGGAAGCFQRVTAVGPDARSTGSEAGGGDASGGTGANPTRDEADAGSASDPPSGGTRIRVKGVDALSR